jgi:uncharacterized protein (DUF433 family)
VLAKLAANPDLDDLFPDYPELTVDQIRDCLRFAVALVQESGHESVRGEALSGSATAPR